MADTTTGASAIKTFFQGLIDTADDTSDVLRQLIPETKGQGDSYSWTVKYGDNSSTQQMTDGGAPPAAGNASYADATISLAGSLKSTTYSITGMARDFAKDGNFDLLEEEFNSALRNHNGAVEDALIVDLEAAVDSAGDYAGLTRSTYKLASYEAESAATAIALSDMDAMDDGLRSDPVVDDMAQHVILSANARQSEYRAVATGTGAGDARITQAGAPVVSGTAGLATSSNSKPWSVVPRMSAGTIIDINLANVKRVVSRPVTVEVYGKTTDADTFVITSNEKIVVPNPRKAGKVITKVV